jgi:putative nucleotidyltransferase with HDIG domain
MAKDRPSHLALVLQVVAIVIVGAVAVFVAPDADWVLPLMAVLFVFAVVSDVTAFAMPAGGKVSGNMVSLILAAVLLGATPAAIIGTATILVGWLKWKDPLHYFLSNLLTFMMFPLAAGIGFHALAEWLGLEVSDASFYLLVVGTFFGALVLNFSMIALYSCYVERDSFRNRVQSVLVPILPSELTTAMMCVAIVYIYDTVGVTAVALAGITLIIFQHLLGQLLLSQQRAEELEVRSKQLVSFQVGVLGALMKTLDMRDKMTARHCASVARYARAIAKEAGMSKSDQELVHITGLMHDIGKFIFPDRILKADTKLNDDDWNLIKMHPQQGANVVASLEGYGPVAKLILAHHERIDGKGYPRGLQGDDIPELSRIISVADTYDVMTARDTYKEPVSSFEAIQELRRVSGTQLDANFVDIFVTKVLEGKDITYRHGEDADFDVELALDQRIAEVEGHDHLRVGAGSNGVTKDAKKRATA